MRNSLFRVRWLKKYSILDSAPQHFFLLMQIILSEDKLSLSFETDAQPVGPCGMLRCAHQPAFSLMRKWSSQGELCPVATILPSVANVPSKENVPRLVVPAICAI